MRRKSLTIALFFLLVGCATSERPPPPLALKAGMGAFALDLTIEPEAVKNRYIYTIAQYDPSTRSVLMQDGELRSAAHFSHNFHIRNGGDELWLEQLPPGHYAITEIEAKLSAGADGSQILYSGHPLGLIIGGLAFLAVAEGSTDVLSFQNEKDVLLPDAPTFRIEAGKVSYAGHITITVDPRRSTFKEYDNDGVWDGHSTVTKTENRYMADYRYHEADLNAHYGRLNLRTYPLLPQPLQVFADRRFLLEDYPDATNSPRSLARNGRANQIVISTPAPTHRAIPAIAPPIPKVLPDTKSTIELRRLFLEGKISTDQYNAALGRTAE